MKIFLCADCGSKKSSKGFYCKICGYKHRTRPSGLKYKIKKVNKSWFKKGNIPWCAGTKGIVKANSGAIKKGERRGKLTEFKRGHTPWIKGKAGIANEEHHNWKGDAVSYSALHSWIYRNLGRPEKCEICKTIKAKRFEWDNISGRYSRNLDDWQRLCSECHANKHKNWRYRWVQ